MTASSYIVFSYRGRDFLSVPARPAKLKGIGLRLYKESSARRRLFKAAIRLGMLVGVDKWIGRELPTPVPKHPSFNFESWLEQVHRDLRISNLQAVISFPGQTGRARFYVNLLSAAGDPVGFAKISLDSKNDRCLATEAQALGTLARYETFSFRLPRVLVDGDFNSHRYLITETLPVNAQPVAAKWETTPRRCRDELAGISRRFLAVRELSWWNAFCELRGEIRSLAAAIDSWADQEIEVGWAHGDFSHRNICRVGNQVWIFDWENSCDDAPLMTDEVRFAWALQSRKMISDSVKAASALPPHLVTPSDPRKTRDLAFALAFLCTRTQGGIVCGRHWSQISQRR